MLTTCVAFAQFVIIPFSMCCKPQFWGVSVEVKIDLCS